MIRFPLHEIVCVDNFLCNDQPRGFITTPTGIALGKYIFLELIWIYIATTVILSKNIYMLE